MKNISYIYIVSRCLLKISRVTRTSPPRFKGITSDLFPGVVLPEPDFGALTSKLSEHLGREHCQPHPYFIEKIIQPLSGSKAYFEGLLDARR